MAIAMGFAELEARLDRLGRRLLEWWAWPAALVLLGAIVLLASWAFIPGEGERVAFLGLAAFPTCPSLATYGLPCGQCGMTRSFAWAARGRVDLALFYNPAGLALWGWMVGAGALGVARLVRRDAGLLRLPWAVLVVAGLLWLGLYFGGQQLRLAGWLPLP